MPERSNLIAANKPATPLADLRAVDCLTGLPGLGSESVDLISCDPPYNQGEDYLDYNDSRPAAEFRAWTYRWLHACCDVLKPTGSLWVFVPDEWVSEVDLYCRQQLRLHRRNWVCWCFTFGQSAKNRFTRSKTHLLYFSKHRTKFTYNADAVKVPSARQLVYGDKRAKAGGKQPDDTWCLLKADLEAALRADGDVWEQSRVCGTYKERQAHSPNQIPLPIMERIVLATSNPGDLVVDPFGGSFTTGVAAVRHNRRFVGFDVSPGCVEAGRKRVDAELARLAAGGSNCDVPGQLPMFPRGTPHATPPGPATGGRLHRPREKSARRRTLPAGFDE